MSVIGRLDGQVDEVIISPVARRGRRAPEAPAEEGPTRPEEGEQQQEPTQKRDRERQEMPVWML